MGLSAELRDRISDADRLIHQLQDLSKTLAKITYMDFAAADSLWGKSVQTRAALGSEIALLLQSVGVVEKRALVDLQAPFLRACCLRLLQIFRNYLNMILERYEREAESRFRMEMEREPDESKQESLRRRFAEERKKYVRKQSLGKFAIEERVPELYHIMESAAYDAPFDAKDKENLRFCARHLSDLERSIWEMGEVSPSTAAFLDKYTHKVDLDLHELLRSHPLFAA